MKSFSVIVFLLVLSNAAFAGQERFNKKKVDCIELGNEANQSYIEAIRISESSHPVDKAKIVEANNGSYRILLDNKERCLSVPSFVTQLIYFDLSNDKLELALNHVNAAINIDPEEASLLMKKTEVLFMLGRDAAALQLMKPAYSNTAIMYSYCGMLVEHQKWNRAVEVCTETIDACKNSDKNKDKLMLPWAYASRANAYSALGEEQEAMADVEKAKDLGLTQPWLWPKELQTEK